MVLCILISCIVSRRVASHLRNKVEYVIANDNVPETTHVPHLRATIGLVASVRSQKQEDELEDETA